jgi:hypothetical protein
MTIAMPDSVRVPDLPPGYPAYLGYGDGDEPTAAELAGRFPHANRIILTVTGRTIDCDGIDCEPGNVNAAATRVWVQQKLKADPHTRPVIYASVEGQPNYGMPWVLAALERNGVQRAQIRLLTAHYGFGNHICGPDTCKLLDASADGTQWTDSYRTAEGTIVDMSALQDNFFGSSAQTETERLVHELGTVRQGDKGEQVKTVQGCLLARGYAIGVSGILTAGIDGVFGPITLSAVRMAQHTAGIPVDGIVGPRTWPVLLGVA